MCDVPQAGQRSRAARSQRRKTDGRSVRFDRRSGRCECSRLITQYRIVSCRGVLWPTHLLPHGSNDTVLGMYTLSRFLQLVGLGIPPLAIVAQLNERITLGQMLGFLVVAICVFLIGQQLQRFSSGGPG